MPQKEIETLDRITWAVWDQKHGIIADVGKLSKNRWFVEDYNGGGVAYFGTRGQAIHYAEQLPDPTDTMSAHQ